MSHLARQPGTMSIYASGYRAPCKSTTSLRGSVLGRAHLRSTKPAYNTYLRTRAIRYTPRAGFDTHTLHLIEHQWLYHKDCHRSRSNWRAQYPADPEPAPTDDDGPICIHCHGWRSSVPRPLRVISHQDRHDPRNEGHSRCNGCVSATSATDSGR